MILKKLLPTLWLALAGFSVVSAQTGGSCLQGAVVSTRAGDTSIDICQGDGLPDIFRFKTSPAAMPFAYLITDENNNILGVSASNIINLEGYPVGTLRVWAFAYLGSITAQVGQNAADGPLAAICSALSANFVTVNSINPDGGTVTTSTGATSAFACVDNTGSNLIEFASSTGGPNYSFIITDASNLIVAVVSGNTFDFGALPPGPYRVWGVALAGPLNAPIGADITTAVLSSQCFGLSSNFVAVLRGDADGGTLSTVSGSGEIKFCRPDEAVLTGLTFQSSSPAGYAYVLTSTSNIIISILPGNTFDPAGLATGNYRIWGLSFSGNVLAQPGDNAAEVPLTDACYDLSDNFISVSLQDVEGGRIELGTGNQNALCVGDGDADVVTFSASGASAASYVFLVTDEAAENVLDFSADGSFDFDGFDAGKVLVWGLSYSGSLSLQPGQSVAELLQSLECADLSENSVSLTLIRTNGGSVSLAAGASSINVCTGDGAPDELEFFADTDVTDEAYTFIVTDASNNIIAFAPSGVVDFEGAGVGVVRVWGLSYSGNIVAVPGDNAATATLTDGCYNLSDNFVTVNLLRTRGGNVSINTGAVFASLCVNDGEPDVLTFSNNSGFAPNYVYLVTDENNEILSVSTTGVIDFEGADAGIVRVWGLSYTGNLTAEPGDNAAEVPLSDECFDLSSNFVIIDKEAVFGGEVQTLFGDTELEFCGGDGFPDVTVFFSSTQSQGDYAFLITDTNNVVLAVTTQNSADFESFGAGVFRIWGLSYTGNILVRVGDNAATTALSDRCSELSENFITVTVNVVDGGQVSLVDGAISTVVCTEDGTPDVLPLFTTAVNPDADYAWLLTNSNNDILVVSLSGDFDFEALSPGVYRIWGLGYLGDLLAAPGQNAGSVALATNCFSLSLNYIEVRVDALTGGAIGLEDGRDFISICTDGVVSNPVEFTTTGFSSGDYAFVLTDEDNVIVGFLSGATHTFDGTLAEGNYRVWGLAYTGTITVAAGDNAAEVALSDACYQLSENFIPLVAGAPDGGTLEFEGGGEQRVVCPDNGIEDLLAFVSGSGAILPYVFLVTDADNVIIDILSGNEYDFEQASAEELRIWGLSYAGILLAQPGDDAAATDLASECYELSANFLTVIRQKPDGGSVSTGDGSTFISTCAGAASDVVSFITDSGFLGNYAFVITNTSNVIIDFADVNSYDFSNLSNDTVRVWGLAYTGNVLAVPGDDAAEVLLTDDCYDLSENFITVFRADPNGGTIATSDGETSLLRCAGDGVSDLINFEVQGASNAPYLFLITDENNYLIGISTQASFDFENAIAGIFRIYGLSYTGVFQLFPGDSIFGFIPASTGCFDFSDTFVEVNNVRVNGGSVFSDTQETVFYTCPADGVPDVISFFNSSSAPDASYAFLFTNEDNIILGLTFQNSFNFDIAGIGVTRIWGVSFTGNFIANFGDNAAEVALSDECYDLSSNFLTVIRDVPAGGTVATSGGETEILICQGIDDPVVSVVNTSASMAAYTYVLTDAFNDILAIEPSGEFDLSDLPEGNYRIWGVSYTGALNPAAGNILSVDFGTSCLEISANFIDVTVTAPIIGGILRTSEGLDNVQFCPGDGVSDLVEAFSTSTTPASNYRYVVANQNNVVFIPDLMGNAIDFDGAGFGEYRIFGIAFSGNYLVGIGTDLDDAVLADVCFALSENFIRVVSAAADGGMVSTSEGLTLLSIDGQDGEPDKYTFINTSTSDLPYVYILTDENNNVLEYIAGDVYDFEGQELAELRVWGLSYFGTAPSDTGVPLSSLVSGPGCRELSENFIQVFNSPPVFTGDDSVPALRATAQPNPAVDRVMLNVWSELKEGSQAVILIMDGAGRIRDEYRLPGLKGFQQTHLDISKLEDGIYTVQIRSAQAVTTLRVVKSSL